MSTSTAPGAVVTQQRSEWPLHTYLPPLGVIPEVVHTARAEVTAILHIWGLRSSLIEDAELVVSELVTNSVQQAQREPPVSGTLPILQVSLFSDRRGVVVCVWDPLPGIPEEHAADDDDEGGRGLTLVSAFGHWDYELLPHRGKVVRAWLGFRAA